MQKDYMDIRLVHLMSDCKNKHHIWFRYLILSTWLSNCKHHTGFGESVSSSLKHGLRTTQHRIIHLYHGTTLLYCTRSQCKKERAPQRVVFTNMTTDITRHIFLHLLFKIRKICDGDDTKAKEFANQSPRTGDVLLPLINISICGCERQSYNHTNFLFGIVDVMLFHKIGFNLQSLVMWK